MPDSSAADTQNKLNLYWLFLPSGRYDGDFRFFIFNVYNCPLCAPTVIFNTLLEIYTQAVARFVTAPLAPTKQFPVAPVVRVSDLLIHSEYMKGNSKYKSFPAAKMLAVFISKLMVKVWVVRIYELSTEVLRIEILEMAVLMGWRAPALSRTYWKPLIPLV